MHVLLATVVLGFPITAAANCYGPAGRTDTLWLIAIELRPDPSVNPQRMMLALLRANPDAFGSYNVNALKAGSVLCFEATDAIEFDDEAAVAEVRRQNREWQNRRTAGSGHPTTAAAVPESRRQSGAAPAAAPGTEPLSGAGRGESEPRDPERVVADFESRLAQLDEQIERLRFGGDRSDSPQARELTATMQQLATALQRVRQRLDRSEREFERLRSVVSNAARQDELAAVRSRLAALEAGAQRDEPDAPGPPAEVTALSQFASRIDEELALLGLRVAHHEEQLRVVIALLEAESEAIEVLKSRLRRSLRLVASALPPEGEPGGSPPSRAPSRGAPISPGSSSVPRGREAPGSTPAPQGTESAMEPMPPPAPQGSKTVAEPMPTRVPEGADPEAESGPASDTTGQVTAQSPPSPAPTPSETALVERIDYYIKILSDHVSAWFSRIKDLW